MSRILVIAPHPDDEVLGCGGTIRKRVNMGDEVCLCVVTHAYTPDWSEEYIANKLKEIQKAQEILGIQSAFYNGFPTVKLDTVGQKSLNDGISRVVSVVRPDEAYIPHVGDINLDHRLVHEASMVALRPKPGSTVKKVLAYETLSETEWGRIPFWPTVYEDISGTIDVKIAAMSAYASELKEAPHPRSLEAIRALAVKRGSEVGRHYAEAFMLVREVRR